MSTSMGVAVVWVVVLVALATSARSQLLLQKPGACSPPSVLQVCWKTCLSDFDCPARDKCCPTSCGGSACSRPVSVRKPVAMAKPGACPLKPSGPWVCASRCSGDWDCRGDAKCCRNRCGALACQRPVR
ncbi:omwaprin-b-like [Bacillus rossius redtenbacheri]|uniref:omwaprin-b-like n=1 Tax=Bacillus rossius redtenbacheri TaxID=93214 RepID=UPI002FDCFBAF